MNNNCSFSFLSFVIKSKMRVCISRYLYYNHLI
nr:MAG TPA: hypothetical protein [Caudoviricetes sp.]